MENAKRELSMTAFESAVDDIVRNQLQTDIVEVQVSEKEDDESFVLVKIVLGEGSAVDPERLSGLARHLLPSLNDRFPLIRVYKKSEIQRDAA